MVDLRKRWFMHLRSLQMILDREIDASAIDSTVLEVARCEESSL
jgi:hypothetical protein